MVLRLDKVSADGYICTMVTSTSQLTPFKGGNN